MTTTGAVNWRTGGLSDPIDRTAPCDPVWVVDTAHGAALVTTEIEAPRLELDFMVRDAGWDLVAVPWYRADAMRDAALAYAQCAASDVLSDTRDFGRDVRDEIVAARLTLSEAEREDMRELGELVGTALGSGLEAWRPGVTTDLEIAAAVSSTLEAAGAWAVCLIVGGDGRLRRLRHPLAVGDVINEAVMAVVVARRAGLHVAATRTCVRRADDEIITLVETLARVNDTVLAASAPGGTWGDTLEALARGYDEVGRPGEWREHYQGGPIGYEQREFELSPLDHGSPFWGQVRRADTAVAWNPSLRGGAKLEDTYLVHDDSLELLTSTPGWPTHSGPRGVVHSAVRVLP